MLTRLFNAFIAFVPIIFFLSCSNSTPAHDFENHQIKPSSQLMKKYSFAEYTKGCGAILLKDGGYIITGFTLDKMVRDKFDSIVFDKKCGIILRVDSNLEKKWVYINEQRYDNEFRSTISINDSAFACFSDIFENKTKKFNSVLALIFTASGQILKELHVPIDTKSSYFNKGALLTQDNSIILYGQDIYLDEKTGYRFMLNKINLDGKVLKKINISIPKQWASDCSMITDNKDTLYFAGSSCSFIDMKLIKTTSNLKTIWEKTIPLGFDPKLQLTKNGSVILAYKDIENGNDLVAHINEFDKKGNILWHTRENNIAIKSITTTQYNKTKLIWHNSGHNFVSISELSEKGNMTNKQVVKIDSIRHTTQITELSNGSLFVMGQQESGSLGSYDSKLVLIKTKPPR